MLADIMHKIMSELNDQDDSYRERPSMSGPERCIRQMVYHASGLPKEPFPGRTLVVFSDGRWHEELNLDLIRKSAFQVHSEQMKVYTPVGEGSIDGIITDLLCVDRLLEVKAINHFSFERYKKAIFPLDYFVQCSLYLHGLQKVNPDINEALLLIKNKNTAAFLEFRLHYDRASDTLSLIEMVSSEGVRSKPECVLPRVTQEAVEKFTAVREHVLSQTLPKRPFDYGTEYPCTYCGYYKICWENYDNEFNKLADNAELDNEIEQLAAYYLETHGHESEMKKEKEELKKQIRDLLLEKGVKSGKAGPYIIKLTQHTTTSLDEEMIPADVIQQAKRETRYERLTIHKPKEKVTK